MLYTSIHNDKIKFYKGLSVKKNRDEANLFIIEGEHLVNEAYKTGFLKEVIILDGYDYSYSVNKNYVSHNVMKYISNLESVPNILGICEKRLNNDIGDKILILDGIQDPGNLGTIIRSAAAFNISTIIMSKDTVDVFNPKVIRASQGMIFKINLVVEDLLKYVSVLKNQGYKVWATNVHSGISIKKVEKMKKFAIIMGNEGSGVRPELQKLSNELLYIDISHNCESLNVAVATSIILYELSK